MRKLFFMPLKTKLKLFLTHPIITIYISIQIALANLEPEEELLLPLSSPNRYSTAPLRKNSITTLIAYSEILIPIEVFILCVSFISF
ncbi:hypothetical protein GCM10027185_24460 [Spirosoma pulveris]